MAGFGLQKFGTTPFGSGTPVAASAPGGLPLRDDNTGLSASGRFIDMAAGQYVFDSYGRPKGMTEARQLVYLAIKTVLGSSAQSTLGQSLGDVKTIRSTFQKDIDVKLRAALAPLIARNLISILAIDVQQMVDVRTRGYAVLRWVDKTTGVEEATQL